MDCRDNCSHYYSWIPQELNLQVRNRSTHFGEKTNFRELYHVITQALVQVDILATYGKYRNNIFSDQHLIHLGHYREKC